MAINASLTGRLRNTSLPKRNALLPLFEAVVNAIQAVDAVHDGMESTQIAVTINRSHQLLSQLGADVDHSATPLDPITGFVVSDNGEGFHDGNMSSFETLDSEYKLAYGCRGVGRLLWLKAFDKVEVASCYKDQQDKSRKRSFVFSANAGVSQQAVTGCDDPQTGSEVRLISFHETYRKAAPKTTSAIARSLLEHCLWYFVRPGGAPNIAVIDGPERVDLTSVYDEYMHCSARTEEITVKECPFNLVHLRLKATAKNVPQLYWCADNRVVSEENLSGRIRGLGGRLRDADAEFMYACFLGSPYLDERVRMERTGFNIPESTEGAFDEHEPSLSDIRAGVLAAAEQHLLPSLEEARRAGRARVETFVDSKAPRYRPILRHVDEDKLSVDPEMSDKDLELQLHRYLADIEHELLTEGQQVLDSSDPDDPEYDRRLRAYLDKVDDVKKSDLAAYVSRRRVILDLLARAIRMDGEGRYAKEDAIHSLIMPLRTTSNDVAPGACNLWLIDEGLAFHNFLASDKPIKTMPITGSTSRKEPDLLALKVSHGPILVSEGESLPLASIVVVEFKRPARDDAAPGIEKDPLSQALQYLERVREGRVTTASGRPIPRSEQVPGFCYVVSDLTRTVQERCKAGNLRPTQDGLGFFGYNDNYKAYIEVVSFDRLLNMAHQRNRAFFDRLGLPAS
ncbi:MAG TPA: hypothetical protein VFM55_23305 [Micromonosporaceae bacterium]|nr:hypothetical protein [Micromonosporaceae bacterium]